jgi:hypothetical protein
MAQTTEIPADLAPLRRSADRLAGLVEQVDAERDHRNRLIREAIDGGKGYDKVAKAARLKSYATVAGIVAGE